MPVNILKLYKEQGFVEFEDLFSSEKIDEWNEVLNKYYEEKKEKVSIDLCDLGEDGYKIIEDFFNSKIRFIIKDLIKDPILFYAGSNEIPSNSKISHVNHNDIGGWHTDTGEEIQYLNLKDPHWITFFVYLSDVNKNDGPFEITNKNKRKELNDGTKFFTMIGKKGKCIVWGNTFYHRAAPNLGNKRRRIIKIQIQHNYLENSYINTLNKIQKYISKNDEYMKFITGSKHMGTYRDWKLDYKFLNEKIKVVEQSNKSFMLLGFIINLKNRIKNILNVN